jgi:hypothetical protein
VSGKILAQKIKKEYTTPVELAQKYYATLLYVHDISLPKRQIQLLAFTAVRGTISSSSSKNEFVRQFGSSVDTINNMISKLCRRKLLVKDNGKIRVRPDITLDFTQKNYIFQLKFQIKEPTDERSAGMVEQGNKPNM